MGADWVGISAIVALACFSTLFFANMFVMDETMWYMCMYILIGVWAFYWIQITVDLKDMWYHHCIKRDNKRRAEEDRRKSMERAQADAGSG